MLYERRAYVRRAVYSGQLLALKRLDEHKDTFLWNSQLYFDSA
jgi:hypothetical protein